ncbi:MAG: hypothetical protein IK017_04705 [Paludibacteraceae bacterium]|nr:hypothetical protein [Paludibacteraceae bacterium]
MGKKIFGTLLVFIVCCNVFAYEFDRTEYYVKVDGKGNGSSWEDAMGANIFAIALSGKYQIKPGTTFHLAKGTYYPELDPFENDHNYSEDEKKRYKVYYVQSPINIIGGYSENPKEGEKPNPSINETVISGANADNPNTDYKEYLYNLFYFDLKEKDRCYFSGLTLTNTSDNRYMDGGAFRFKSIDGTILEMDRCKTKELTRSFSYANFGIDDIILSNCIFDNFIADNSSSALYIYANKAVFNSCTFIESTSSISVNDLTIQNCTFAQTSIYIYSYEKATFHNNTVVRKGYNGSQNGFFLRITGEASIIGNIFNSQVDIDFYDENSTGVSKYNLYSKPMDEEDNPLYDKTTDYIADLNGVIESDLSYEKSYTPYFKLLRDFLPDGRTVHFPLTVTSVSNDQRAVERFDKTCMGSYEKRDTVIFPETKYIQAGGKFQGNIYDTIGYYFIPVISPNAAECDSVTLHKLYVLPNDNDKRTTFYVKTNGKGDGSSWDKAMSPKDFAWRLSLSKRIDTFHVAAGTYNPIEMEYSRCFERSLPVCIIGGYPENCSDMSQEPNPVQYKTIFSVDFNNDNTYVDERIANIDEDGSSIFVYTPQKKGKSLISGIVFDGGNCGMHCTNSQCLITVDNPEFDEFTFEQCEFRNSLARSVICNFDYDNNTNDVLNFNNCYFNRVGEYYFKYPVQYGGNGIVNFNACTFKDLGNLAIYSLNDQIVTYSNCTAFNCSNIMIETNEFSSKLNLINNTIYSSAEFDQNNKILINDFTENINLIGNIIHANFNENSVLTGIHSNYNIYLNQSNIDKIKSENDIVVEDFSFLDSRPSSVNNVITPVLVMTSDTLPDGTSLRFPLSETKVTTDQRKKNRFRMTSMGSYEANTKDDIIPTAFTPFDSNGKNDIFMLDHEVYIYDVYGMLICHSENGWNGMIDEEKANPGIYVYAVKTYSGEIKRGTVELLIQQ